MGLTGGREMTSEEGRARRPPWRLDRRPPGRRTAFRLWSAILAPIPFAVAACGDLGFEARVDNRRPFDPPPIYREWWAATETCSGREAPFGRIDWYLATAISGDGLVARGRWSEPHEIIIVIGYEDDEAVVRHEMLHDLLGGDRDHTRSEWDDCAPDSSRASGESGRPD